MLYNSREKFLKLIENSKYIRVDESHPLELYLGLDSEGNKTLRLNEKFDIQSVISSAKIAVHQYKDKNNNSLLLSNMGDDGIFFQFCNDLIDTSRKCEIEKGYQFILNRYYNWKKMFATNNELLSLQVIMGLIGELLFLRKFSFLNYGIRVGVVGWSGPEPTNKDFSYGKDWFEIKSLSANKSTVMISSIEQLDSVCEGTLVLFRLEKMSTSYEGISLNKLIWEIKSMLEDESTLDMFEEKLIQVGYSYAENYDESVFSLISIDAFKVSENFPRLERNVIPSEISNVKYELDINSIEKFKVNLW